MVNRSCPKKINSDCHLVQWGSVVLRADSVKRLIGRQLRMYLCVESSIDFANCKYNYYKFYLSDGVKYYFSFNQDNKNI